MPVLMKISRTKIVSCNKFYWAPLFRVYNIQYIENKTLLILSYLIYSAMW